MKLLTKLFPVVILVLFQLQLRAQSWNITGNAGTNSSTNFIGTSDNRSFAIRSNNIGRIFIDSVGKVGIGTTTPNCQLHFSGGKFLFNATSASVSSLIKLKYKLEIQNFTSSITFATFDAVNGRVGIGTTSPSSELEVVGVIKSSSGNSIDWSSAFSWGNHATAGYITSFVETDPQVGTIASNYVPKWSGSLVTGQLYDNGTSIGLGTTTLTDTKFSVVQTGLTLATAKFSNATKGPGISWVHFGATGNWYIRSSADNGDVIMQDQHSAARVCIGGSSGFSKLNVEVSDANYNSAEFKSPSAGPNVSYIHNGSAGNWFIRSAGDFGKVILQDQNDFAPVCIGTTTAATGYKLSVKGKIICEEVKVQFNANWPDYVFDQSYELLSLNELKTFISINKHLPGVPSAEQVKVADGIEVGEMQKQLLTKIEELTLYIIKLDEDNKKLTARIDQLQKK